MNMMPNTRSSAGFSSSMYPCVFSYLQFKIDMTKELWYRRCRVEHKIRMFSVFGDIRDRKGRYWCSKILEHARQLLRTYPDMASHAIDIMKMDSLDAEDLTDSDYHDYFGMCMDRDFHYSDIYTDSEDDGISIHVPDDYVYTGPDYETLSASFEIQTEEIDYKTACKETFKERNKHGKRKVDKIAAAAKLLTKGERHKLIAALKKAQIQAGEEFERHNIFQGRSIDEISSPGGDALKDFFVDFPFGYKILLEIIRTSLGVYISTTPHQVIHHLVSSAISLGMSYASDIHTIISGLFMDTQAGEGWHEKFLSTMKFWKDNSVLDGVKKGIIVLVSLGFAKMECLSGLLPTITSLLGDPKLLKLDSFDIVSYAMSVYLFLAKRIKCALEAKSLWGFFTPVPELYELSNRLDAAYALAPYAFAGRIMELRPDLTIDKYADQVYCLLQEVTKTLTVCDRSNKVLVMGWHRKIIALNTQVLMKLNDPIVRQAPFSINMFGSSGVGKTMIIPVIAKCASKPYDIDVGPGDIFYRNPDDKFWSGYHGQTVVVENEKNATKPMFAETNENKTTLDIVDNAPLQLNMADVDSKGIYTMRSLVHIMTTNQPNAQAELTSNEPAAVMRRSLHIGVEVAPKNRKPGSDMLDTSTVTGDPIVDDCQLFTVMDVETLPSKDLSAASGWQWVICKNEHGKLMNKVSMHDLLTYITYRVKLHIERQKIIVANVYRLSTLQLCEHGSGPTICRECNGLPEPEPQLEVINMGHPIKNWSEVTGCVEGHDWLGRPNKQRHQGTNKFENQAGVGLMLPVFLIGYSLKFGIDRLNKYFITRFLCAYLRHTLWNTVLQFLSIFDWVGSEPVECGTVSVFKAARTMLMSPGMVKHGLRAVGERSCILQFALCCLYYSFLPFFAFNLLGYGVLWSFIIGDSMALGINHTVYSFYQRMDARGATNSLKDWAAMKARPYLTSKFNYIAFASVVTGCLLTYKMLNQKKFVEQGGVQSVWRDDVVWNVPYKPPMQGTEQQKTTVPQNLVKLAEKSIAYVRLYQLGTLKCVPCNIMPVESGIWIGPAHALCDEKHTHMDLVLNTAALGANLNQVPIDRAKVKRIGDTDLALIYIVQTGGFMKNMMPYYTDDHASSSMMYVYKKETGEIKYEGDNTCRMELMRVDRPYCPVGYAGQAPYVSFAGLCGAVTIAHRKLPAVVGLHIAGVPDRRDSVCAPIYKSAVATTIQAMFTSGLVLQTSSFEDMDLSDGDFTKNIVTKHNAKSPIGFIESGHIKYFGTTGVRYKGISSVRPTLMSMSVADVIGCKNVFGNPEGMRSWKIWHKTMTNLTQPHFKDPVDLQEALHEYYGPIHSWLKRQNFKHEGPMSERAMLDGEQSSNMRKHVVVSTSTGYPFRKPKSDFITPVYYAGEDVPWHFEMNDDLRARMVAVEERALNGLRPNCMFSTSLKTEAKVVKKVVNGELIDIPSKPRVFYPAPVELVLIWRKYFMPIEDALKDCPECEYAIGINAMGDDWSKLADSLQEYGDNNMPNDVQGWDQSVTPEELLPHVHEQIKMAEMYFNYSERDLKVMRGIASALVYPLIDFDSDIVNFCTLLGSGGVFTAQNNSKINSVRLRMPYCKLLREGKLPKVPFRSVVRVYTYGDDSIPSLKSCITHVYNLASYAEYWKQYGVVVTDANKSDVLVPILPLKDCDFLKRGFRRDEERGVWTAPLAEKSIFKRLHTFIPSSVLNEHEQCGEALASSLRDYFEYGREIFDIRRLQLIEIARRCGLESHVPGGFPDYDVFVLEYDNKYRSEKSSAVMRK